MIFFLPFNGSHLVVLLEETKTGKPDHEIRDRKTDRLKQVTAFVDWVCDR